MGYKRIKVLESTFKLSREEAKEIDSLMTLIRKVSGSKAEKILSRVNQIIGGYGVEAIISSKNRGGYYGDVVAKYINMGDTYDTTIVFNTITTMPMIMSFGYFVEKNTRRYKIL